MKVTSLKIPDVKLIEPDVFEDERGFFYESFNQQKFNEAIGQDILFVQDNHSKSSKGVLRGLHYQEEPFLESKLISCIKGSVVDVLLDMRPTSETYGKYASYRLTPGSGSLLVPPLVAHGFQTLEDETTLLYLHSNGYSPDYSQGVNPLDPGIGISWPLPISSISESDRNLPSFSEVKN